MTLRPSSILAGSLALVLAGAAAAGVPEHELKAAFVFNFASFVDWPDGSQPLQHLVLCDRTGSGLSQALSGLDGKTIHGHQVVYRDVRDQEQSDGCHAVVLDASAAATGGGVRPAGANVGGAAGTRTWWQRPGVLSVADGGEAGRNGAVITLVRDGSRVRFDVDSAAAERAGITLSSQLLRLARRVL